MQPKDAQMHGRPFRAAKGPVQSLAVQNSIVPYCKRFLSKPYETVVNLGPGDYFEMR